jgi:hypothetical protein
LIHEQLLIELNHSGRRNGRSGDTVMRSDRIVKTFDMGQNRFELCHQTFKAIRKLHNPGHRIQDTTNDALQRLAGASMTEAAADTEKQEAALDA